VITTTYIYGLYIPRSTQPVQIEADYTTESERPLIKNHKEPSRRERERVKIVKIIMNLFADKQ
jgi:hypothetical protein